MILLNCFLTGEINLNRKMKKPVIGFLLVSISLLCVMISPGQTGQERAQKIQLAVIREVLQTTSYTYLHVKADTGMQWLAVRSMDARVGDTCYYTGGLVMPDFTSKELKRTFDKVIFMEGVSKTPEGTNKHSGAIPEHGSKTNPGKLDIAITAAPDGITVAELFKNKDNYNGKMVKIRGQVVKFKSGIMGKNWVHLQDGTAFGDKFDLTATTSSTVSVGEVITLESKVTINRDFGSGYFFEVILEDALVR
jgi:hypothetical protein